MKRAAPLVLLAALVAAAGCTVNPVTGKSQIDLLGEAQEVQIGNHLYPGAIQSSLGAIAGGEVGAEAVRRVRSLV